MALQGRRFLSRCVLEDTQIAIIYALNAHKMTATYARFNNQIAKFRRTNAVKSARSHSQMCAETILQLVTSLSILSWQDCCLPRRRKCPGRRKPASVWFNLAWLGRHAIGAQGCCLAPLMMNCPGCSNRGLRELFRTCPTPEEAHQCSLRVAVG